MSLIESMMEECCLLNEAVTDMGILGRRTVYSDGESFRAAIIKAKTPEVITAEKAGAEEKYTIVAGKGLGLKYHDIIKRMKDGQLFRATSNQEDSEAPEMSTVAIGKVSAERWEMPND